MRCVMDTWKNHNINESNFVFSSPYQKYALYTEGVFSRLNEPALGSESKDSSLQKAIHKEFNLARQFGQKNPIVVGAIPFDVRRPSRLFIPKSYKKISRDDLITQSSNSQIFHAKVIKQTTLPSRDEFKQQVQQVIAACQKGKLKKAVLSRLLMLETSEPVDAQRFFSTLVSMNSTAYHFHVPLNEQEVLIGASPETLLHCQDNNIYSMPLAGSIKHQQQSEADNAAAAKLFNSLKDRHEHALVVDEISRLLAPHCQTLSVPKEPILASTTTLWHLATPIEGRLKQQQNALQLACLLHPTPALCGYPTDVAKTMINDLEPFNRELFGGIVGWCDAEGNGEFAITIRSAIIHDRSVQLFAGAGIVEASQPDAEWSEIQLKLNTILSAFGLVTEF
ncbi:hypothetical protein B5800_12445 [Gilliamella apicola]|nr:hypothetical protein B5800_12445 [Gilliamella apicola]ORF47499.1 hypothetical protein B5799_12425 [Gilliamella apicola]ORF48272.1 hypothetical protein B5803_11360 [Gilliamella apicola]ORF52382.1 hypothetical protein B5798_11915 [Gilliamella apicola]ORF54627.1 hypothetical protein B5802_07800 [Gilliamella apicola]